MIKQFSRMEQPDEQSDWRIKYNPHNLRLGMVSPDDFVDLNDEKYFEFVSERVAVFEKHIDEKLPEDFMKYMIYCGPLFYNWSVCGIGLSGWNKKDKNDQRPFCIWCDQPLTELCTCTNWFDGTNVESDNQPGLIRFSHEGCGMFKFIVVKGPLKGTIWSGHPNGDDEYLSKDKGTFKELLDRIYNEK